MWARDGAGRLRNSDSWKVLEQGSRRTQAILSKLAVIPRLQVTFSKTQATPQALFHSILTTTHRGTQ